MGVVSLFNQLADNSFGFFQQVQTVGDVLGPKPGSLTLDNTLSDVVELLNRERVHHVPVLDPDTQSLIGVVSDRDVLRQTPSSLGTAAEQDEDQKALRTAVPNFMTRNPIWCTRECSLVKAMSLMLEHHIDSVLVSPDGKALEGIVTPRDFVRTLLLYHTVCTRDVNLRRLRLVDLDFGSGLPLDEIFARGAQTARDVMTKDVVTIAGDQPTSEAIRLMREHEIRHLPVVDSDNSLVGMLSDRDVLRHLPPSDSVSQPDETAGFRDALFDTENDVALRQTVQTIMSREANPVSPDMLLTDALTALKSDDVCGLPVVEKSSSQLCGILTTSDVLKVFRVVMQLGDLARS